MRKYILNTIAFLFVLLLFNIVLFKFAENNYYQDYQVLPPRELKSFLFSDSHGLPLKKLTEDHNTFNFSAGSDSYMDIERKLIFLIDNNYDIKSIYLTADDHTLSPYRDQFNNLDRSVFYLIKSNEESHYSYIKQKYIKSYLPIFQPKTRSLFKSWLTVKLEGPFHSKKKSKLNNEIWFELSYDERRKRAIKRKESQFPTGGRSSLMTTALENIILLCNKNNIQVIGIKFPLSKIYIEEINGNSFKAEEIFYRNNIPVMDFKSAFTEREDFFANQDHLNDIGAQEFVKIIFD